MEWVKLSTSYYLDPAVASLPDADCEIMFLRSLSYCGAAETGGFIPDAVLSSLGRRKQRKCAEALVDAGLWEISPCGWVIPKWERWQAELEAILQRRRSDRERQRRHRASRDNGDMRHVTDTTLRHVTSA